MPYLVKLRAAHKECQEILDKYGVEWNEKSTRKLIITDEELEHLRKTRREGIKDPWKHISEAEATAEREPTPEKAVKLEPTEPEPVEEPPANPMGEETVVEEDDLRHLRDRAKAAGVRGPIGAMREGTLREKLADLE